MDVIHAHWKPKVWGETACVKAHPLFEVHAIRGLPGGFCSRHRHHAKWNHFHVVAGELLIRIWPPEAPPDQIGRGVDERHLTAGQMVVVAPGVLHQFEVIAADTQAIEIYWTAIDPDDIDRIT